MVEFPFGNSQTTYEERKLFMNGTFTRLALAVLCVLLLVVTTGTLGQQVADPNFDAKVAHPAHTEKHPKVLFDEAHLNFHTPEGRYKPFVDLITNDGYQVTPNKEKFQKKVLEGYDILVIANALGAQGPAGYDTPAFTEEECDVVRDWVREDGSLLLIADHAPFGVAADNLAKRFGVEMSKGYTTDSANSDKESGNPGFLVFTRESGLLADHPITQGRDSTERINRVITFTGQSLKGPEGSAAFLKLADTATDTPPPSAADVQAAIAKAQTETKPPAHLSPSQPLPPGAVAIPVPQPAGAKVSAAGRAQGIALKVGKGRVVVLGEAAMLSAQVAGPEKRPVGLNHPGIDNRQLALNIMHWLSGLLN